LNVTVMLPTLNEERTIALTIQEVRETMPHCKIVVVDSYSKDKTAFISRESGAEVILTGRGKGNAVREAVPQLAETDIVIMMDSDYTYPARHIPEAVSLIEHGSEVIIGYRKWKDPGAMSVVNSFGNRCLSLLAGCLYLYPVRDVCTGFWGFRADILRQLEIVSPRFTLEAELFGAVMKSHRKVRQIPIKYRARPNGSRTKLRVSDGYEIAMFLIGDSMRRWRSSQWHNV